MLARKALAGTAGAPKEYVEDVFSTYLYTGNASTQTITNNIDISGKGGLVWTKSRSNATGHILFDTQRGLGTSGNRPDLHTELQDGQVISGEGISSFNSDGYTLENTVSSNGSGRTFVSWTFRKAKKFFDVVTFTTNSSEPPNTGDISHNLGSTPGCVIVKKTSGSQDWKIYHRSLSTPTNKYLQFDTTAVNDAGTAWINVSSTTISFPGTMLDNSSTYVAYLFAHDAGGFGDAGSDNVISCGSFTTSGTGEATVTLNYEPQWLLLKPSSTTGNWLMVDTMRGWNVNSGSNILRLRANLSDAEDVGGQLNPTATGFKTSASGALVASQTYIYIAIRRGPMKTPTSGTSVFTPVSTSGDVSEITAGFPVDFALGKEAKNGAGYGNYAIDRLRGGSVLLETNTTGAEYTSQTFKFDSNTKFLQSGSGVFYGPSIYWLMRRAPGFFDVVCYTGTGANRTLNHNLGVAPELIIQKSRAPDPGAVANYWLVGTNFGASNYRRNWLQLTDAGTTYTYAAGAGFYSQPTSTTFGITDNYNASGTTYVVYLFASCPGVSKVGSYTGNGSSVTVTTDFQPRFILVKRTDSTGDWLVSDSARGLVAGNDPYIELNTADAEVTNEDWVDISSTSFTVNQTTNNANVNTGTYIYLAIA